MQALVLHSRGEPGGVIHSEVGRRRERPRERDATAVVLGPLWLLMGDGAGAGWRTAALASAAKEVERDVEERVVGG